jgi:hypothetical protein
MSPLTPPLTLAERRLRALMRAYAALFAVAAVAYLTLPNTALGIANGVSRALGDWPPIPLSTERFWVVLSFSMLVTLTVLAYSAQRDIRQNRALVLPILICKASSTICYLAFFATDRHLAYLMGALTDGTLLAVGAVLYRSAVPVRSDHLDV